MQPIFTGHLFSSRVFAIFNFVADASATLQQKIVLYYTKNFRWPAVPLANLILAKGHLCTNPVACGHII